MKIAPGLTALLICALPFAAQAETPEQLLAKSARAMKSGHWPAGLRHTRTFLEVPALSREQLGSGLAHLCIHLTQLGRSDEADGACNDSLARAALVDLVVTLADAPRTGTRIQQAEQILAEP